MIKIFKRLSRALALILAIALILLTAVFWMVQPIYWILTGKNITEQIKDVVIKLENYIKSEV